MQVFDFNPSRPIAKQQHGPLGFASGPFSGASFNWSVVEKEGYAVLAGITRFNYYTLSASGVRIYTDHRNLQFIFNPLKYSGSAIPKHTESKLARWAVVLSEYSYIIEQISGTDNVLADLLTRWAARRSIGPVEFDESADGLDIQTR